MPADTAKGHCYAMYCKRERFRNSKNCLPHALVVLASAKILHMPYAVTQWLMFAVYTKSAKAESRAFWEARHPFRSHR